MIGLRRQHPRPVRGRPILTALAGGIVFAGVLILLPGGALHDLPGRVGAPLAGPAQPIDDWAHGGYRQLPAHVHTLRGHGGAPLNIQAAGGIETLHIALRDAGWRPAGSFGPAAALRSLAPDTPIATLPVLPRVHDGRRPALVFTHPAAGSPGRRWVLRLWSTARVTAHGGVPLWVGLLDSQRITHELHLLTTARDQADYRAAAAFMARNLAAHRIRHCRVKGAQGPLLLMWPENRDAMLK